MLKVRRIAKDSAYSRSSVSLALKIRRKSSFLERNRFAKAGPQTGRRKKQVPGRSTRWRARPRHKKRGPVNTGGAPLWCTGRGPLELSPAPFPVRGPGCSGAGRGLNFAPLPRVRCGAGRENLAPPRPEANTSRASSGGFAVGRGPGCGTATAIQGGERLIAGTRCRQPAVKFGLYPGTGRSGRRMGSDGDGGG